MSDNKTIYYQNGTFSVEDGLFYENGIRMGYFEDEKEEEKVENNHKAVVDRLIDLRDSNIDLKRSNKKLRKENEELKKQLKDCTKKAKEEIRKQREENAIRWANMGR